MPQLRASDRVAVVAPSGPFPREDLARGVQWWSERLTVTDLASPLERHGFLAAEDTSRVEAFCAALEDPTARALLCARGGYGATRLLERAADRMLAALARDAKPLVGYSDITALHALWARAGVRSVHGPMVASTGRGNAFSAALWRVLQGESPDAWEGLEPLRSGRASGPAVGGNLTVLTALLSTPWMPALDGCVLFLEDVTEKPYRVDRMLTTLRMAGVFARVSAVVLGEFVQCEPGVDGVTVGAVLRERVGDLGIPVVSGAPFGHGDNTAPFVLGARVDVHADEGRVVFCEGL